MKSALFFVLPLACFSVARAERPAAVSTSYYGSPGSQTYRAAMAEERRQARRASERMTWARLAIKHPPVNDEARADCLVRLVGQFGAMGKWELRDNWYAKVADELPATAAAATARWQLGR